MTVVHTPSLFGIDADTVDADDGLSDVLTHPAVRTWFHRTFTDGATEPQLEGWPHIAARRDTLIAAPTGSGKTLAGFLVCIDRLYAAHARGEPVAGRTQVVYASPLKALAVDIGQNLERPLAEIRGVADEMGLDAPALTVAVRTGDTPSHVRAAMVKRPANFVVTTPESLYLLLTAEKSREVLRTVDTVIVDEIHAVARDKRGTHLALTLERLEHVADQRPVRIGLSATQKPISTVSRLLVGTRTDADGNPACAVVDAGHQRTLDLALELPDGELEAVASAEQMGDVLTRIAELVGQHRTTIVFVNTRRLAERLAHQLGEMLGEDVVSAHHGSLSKDRRLKVETRLRAGELKALVATASLELGIDIGPVELVCQIGSPRSIATFLQRVGRSNHTRAGTPRGRLYPLTRDELVECAALLKAVRAGRLDAIEPSVAPRDILVQQIVAEVAAEEWTTDDLFALVRRSSPYADLARATFDELVDLAANGVETGQGRRAAYLFWDKVNGELRPRKGARLTALTSGGAIPEVGDFRVVAEPDEMFVGTVNEDWATESMAGDIFLLGTTSWQIRRVESGVVRVVDAHGAPPSVPFWLGEAPGRTRELSEEVSDLRSEIDQLLGRGDADGARSWLCEVSGVPDAASTMIVDYLAYGRAVLGVMPTQSDLVFERFFDDSGGMQLVVHSPFGARLNRAFGFALRKKFCRSFNFELQAAASDDAFLLSLGPHHSFALADVAGFLSSGTVDEALEQAILDSPLFQSRWRWNLNRSLLVLRWRGGRRNPPNIQRMQADDMMAALFPQAAACQENVAGTIEIPDHPVVTQTIEDTLTEALDAAGLKDVLDAIDAGDIRVHFKDTTEASPLSHEIVTARPYAFLDDGEIQDRRTNAVPVRRGIPTDPTAIGHLDPDEVRRVTEEARAEPRDADELCDLLQSLVATRPRPEWAGLFADLVARGRARAEMGPDGELWVGVESEAWVAALLDESCTATPSHDEAVVRSLRGHLDISGPVTATQLAAVTGLGGTDVAVGLATLESEGVVIQGRFGTAPPAAGAAGPAAAPTVGPTAEVEWVARRLLARMHVGSRKRRRASVEAVTPEAYQRFLLRWHRLTPGNQRRDQAGLAEAIEQLQGFEVAAGSWESEILTRRVRGFRPEWLDRLCHRGEIGWLRLVPGERSAASARSSPSRATPVTLCFRADIAWLLQAGRAGADELTVPEGATAEVVDALDRHGARFLAELVTDTGRLPAEIEAALWDGVARGLVTADGFAAIRSLLDKRSRPARPSRRVSRLRRGAGLPGGAAGRWSLVGAPAEVDDADELAEAVADQLLTRWGVVCRDLAARESVRLPWRDVQWALRRLEDRGLVRGGRFVRGLSGEQFALPEAVDLLGRIRKGEGEGVRVTVAAVDPVNLTGLVMPGERVPAVGGRTVTFEGGTPIL